MHESSAQVSVRTSSDPSSGITEVAPRQVLRWLADNQCVLIDIREPDEHARESIAGSQLAPLSRFDLQQVASMAKPGQQIVFHCRGGKRSADACRMAASLAASGFTVNSMSGGIEAWKAEHLNTVVNREVSAISVMRQVQLVIGTCVLTGSALAWLVHPAFLGVPAFFGAGLVFAGASGTCALASLLEAMPWNRSAGLKSTDSVTKLKSTPS